MKLAEKTSSSPGNSGWAACRCVAVSAPDFVISLPTLEMTYFGGNMCLNKYLKVLHVKFNPQTNLFFTKRGTLKSSLFPRMMIETKSFISKLVKIIRDMFALLRVR